MKIHKLNCPNCNGILDMKIDDNTYYIFCPYCGQQFMVDDEKKEYTINKNINISKNIHKRYTDDAEVIKAINKDKEDKRIYLMLLVCFAILIGIAVIPSWIMNMNEKRAVSEGKISAGFYRDLIGEDYKTVEAHFDAAGFTNIELIDLDDAGLAIWKNGKVETISVGGDTNFDSTDFFEPDTKVVISYH